MKSKVTALSFIITLVLGLIFIFSSCAYDFAYNSIEKTYINENGELILVDYKTDRVTEENYVDRLKELHSSQLYYYKLAIEKIYGRKLSKVLIYSVPLGKTVLLD